MQISAVFACIKILAETIASLPLKLYRRQSGGRKVLADDHPLYAVLHDRPNAWQTSYGWRETLVGWLTLRGNAFCRIVPGSRYFVGGLHPIRPDMMSLQDQEDDGRLVYRYSNGKGRSEILFSDEIFRLNGLSADGLEGLSPVTVARRSFGIAGATDEHAAQMFANGTRLTGILRTDAALSEGARKNISASWKMAHGGPLNSGKTAVLDEGLTWQQVSMSAEDSQFLENRRFQVSDIARWFNMPLHKLGELERSTHTNIEAQQIDFVVHTLRPWLVNIEQSIKRDLFLPGRDDDVFPEFAVEGLLRGDHEARSSFYKAAVNDGWMTRNEVRNKENMNDLPGLDRPMVPLNFGFVEDDGSIDNPNEGAANVEAPPAGEPGQQNARLKAMTLAGAERAVTRECNALTRAWKDSPDSYFDAMSDFYDAHSSWMADVLQIPTAVADRYCDAQRDAMCAALENEEVEALCAEWKRSRAAELCAAVMELG